VTGTAIVRAAIATAIANHAVMGVMVRAAIGRTDRIEPIGPIAPAANQ
jgi:hypothetical protein